MSSASVEDLAFAVAGGRAADGVGCALQQLLDDNHSAQAEALLESLRSSGATLNSNLFNVMIGYWAERGDMDRAEEWLQKMTGSGVAPNCFTWTTLINACVDSEDVDRLAKYKKVIEASGLDKDDAVYNNVIKVLSHRGDVQTAQKILNAMDKIGIPIMTATYNSLINTCTRAGETKRAQAFMEQLLSAGLAPDAVTYNSLINGCAQEGDLDQLLHWLHRMVADGIQATLVTYGTLCKAYAFHGMVDMVDYIMGYVEQSGHELNAHFYASLIIACTNSKPPRHTRAEQVGKDMVSRGLSPKTVRVPLQRLFGVEKAAKLVSTAEKLLKINKKGKNSPNQNCENKTNNTVSQRGSVSQQRAAHKGGEVPLGIKPAWLSPSVSPLSTCRTLADDVVRPPPGLEHMAHQARSA